MSLHANNSKAKELVRYVLPSMGTMVFNALYVVIDGVFVGQGVGDLALAGVNMAMPILGMLMAVAVMLIMGGATISAVSMGRGNKDRANAVFLNCVMVAGVLSIIFSGAALFYSKGLAALCGAQGELQDLTAAYMQSYLGFGFFFTMSYLMAAFVRNDGNPSLAFFGMAAGTVSNIFLDWLFIYPLNMGIFGAGLASGLGTVLSFCILLTHFTFKRGELRLKRPKFSPSLTGETLKRGFPEFVTSMWNPVMTYCYNIIALKTYGEYGVSSFSMVGYLLYVQVAMSSGIAQGVQPLISRRFGEGKHSQERYFFRTGLVVNILVSALVYALTLIFGKTAYRIFSDDSANIALAYHATIFIGIGMLISAVNISYSGYFLATARTRQAVLLSVFRAFVFTAPFILFIPLILGEGFVWCGIIGSELCVAALAAILFARLPKHPDTE